MSSSSRAFDRWQAHDRSTWAFQVFRKYNTELYKIIGSHVAGRAYVYHKLGENNASWKDVPSTYFSGQNVDLSNFPDLKSWSNSYNMFDNWVNLSTALTLASNLETYMASAISLAIDSDPGILLGAPRSVDGAAVLKHRTSRPPHLSVHIDACTKGEWSQRLSAFEALFGPCPPEMRAKHSELEELRAIRNRFGHAFGRDIDASRRHGHIEIGAMEKVSRKRTVRLSRAVWWFARTMDRALLHNHIGDFEAVNYYQNLYPRLRADVHAHERAVIFKKSVGKFGAGLRGKAYCKGLVKYWEAL